MTKTSFLLRTGAWLIGLTTAFAQAPQPVRSAQRLPTAVTPGYLLFPIRPGEANSLSGGLGDLRANHFHAGLDIRTGGREGLDVYAAADGYVSRIAVFTGGYGNVVFIKHPNGLTTVYGHLQVLNDTLGRYLRQEQYKQETFEIDLRPAPGQFPVRRGDVIALSGNTGGSGGPHLHFEVRDERDNLINPLLFGFSELTDDVPPYFEKIALRTLTPDSRVNGEYTRLVVTPVRRPDGRYVLPQPITASGLLGLELLAYDKTTGSPYRNGLSCIEIRLDGREVFAYNMDSFPHEQSRYINVHMNYEVEQLTGQRYHRCYVADGNELTLYRLDSLLGSAYRGRLPLLDGKPHEVTVTLFDTYQNQAELTFTVLPEPEMAVQTLPTAPKTNVPVTSITPDDNLLKLTVRNLSAGAIPPAILFEDGERYTRPHSYVRNNQVVYLIDLNETLPDSIQIGSGMIRTGLRQRIRPGQAETYQDDRLRLQFAPKTLFDTLHLAVRHLSPTSVEVNQYTVPLNDFLSVSYRVQSLTTPEQPGSGPDLTRTHMYAVSGGRKKFLGGTWTGNRIDFRTRDLGRFQLLTDTLPPKVQLLAKTANSISAKISDDLSGIATFRALVNGEWVLMQYDYKRALIWSDKLDPTRAFQGPLVLTVTDRAGNQTVVEAVIP